MNRATFNGLVFLLAINGSTALGKLTPEQAKSLPPPANRSVNFSRDIKPIVEASCIKCHGRGRAKGDFRLDSRETLLKGGSSGVAAIPGKSGESYLIELVSGVDPDNVMPRKGSRLTPDQVGLLRAWIDQGLPWDKDVSFARKPPLNLVPRKPRLPPARQGIGNPVDRLLRPYFAAHHAKVDKWVDDRVFARRVYLDVIGVLPSPQELDAFLADKRTGKRAQLVDKLLADQRRYAEHWLTFWNDLLRNDYRGTGYIDGGRKQISSWLFAALAGNMPYDRFVAALVNPTPENEGFVKGIIWRGVVNASQTPEMQSAQNISQVFMGVNLKCASCHDSLINDWTLADAYGMAGIYATNRLEMFECDKPTGKKARVKFLYPELGDIAAEASQADRQQRLAEILTSTSNGRLSRTVVNRLWARFMGRGLVEPVDDMEQVAWSPDLLDWLAEDLAAHGYDLKRTLNLILTSRAYQMPAVSLDEQRRADYVFTGPAVRRMTAEQFRDALAALTGVWFEMPATQFDFTAASGREANASLMPKSAQWIWSDANAAQKARPQTIYLRRSFTLTELPGEAFVVAACDNSYTLYVNGNKVLSGRDYTQPNFADIRPHLKPGENLLAVAAVNHTPDNKPPADDAPPKDSDANPAGFFLYARIRSAAADLSRRPSNPNRGFTSAATANEGILDLGTDAAWTWSVEKKDGWEKPGYVAQNWRSAAELGEAGIAPWNLNRKFAATMSVALVHGEVRAGLVAADPMAVALGRPNREQVMTSRQSAATTLQALELTNGETLARLLKRGAEKVLAEKSASSQQLVKALYRKALGREPSPPESRLAEVFLGGQIQKEGVEDLLWAMVMLPEFQLIY